MATCACGTNFTVEHALSCAKGGYPSIRHNEIRDFTANLMSEVCHNVAIEPHLQPITGEILSGASANTQDGARLDVAADGFWGSRFERAFFDVRYSTRTPPQTSNPNLSCQALGALGVLTPPHTRDLHLSYQQNGIRPGPLQHHHGLDQVQAVLLSPTISHHVQ